MAKFCNVRPRVVKFNFEFVKIRAVHVHVWCEGRVNLAHVLLVDHGKLVCHDLDVERYRNRHGLAGFEFLVVDGDGAGHNDFFLEHLIGDFHAAGAKNTIQSSRYAPVHVGVNERKDQLDHPFGWSFPGHFPEQRHGHHRKLRRRCCCQALG